MSYAILAKHRGGEKEVEICRVESQKSAVSISKALAAETHIDREPGQKSGRAVSRYLSVRVQEITA